MARTNTDTQDASARRIRDAVASGTLTSAPPAADPNGNAPPAQKESKADRFRRLANARLPKLLKAARQVANLAAKGSYEYTEEQRQKLLKLVSDAGKMVLDAFTERTDADGKENLPF